MTTLESIQRVTASKPPRIVIYGPPGVGKTSMAAEFPSPIFIQTEDGESAGLEFDAFPKSMSYQEAWESLKSLANPQHDYKFVVVDSGSSLEPLVWAETCLLNNWASIEEPGWQKGYIEALPVWTKFLNGLDYLRDYFGMGWIILAHSEIVSYPNPTGQEFPRWDIAIHKKARALIERKADAIFMLDYDSSVRTEKGKQTVKSTGSQERFIHCNGSPARNAKNRYNLDDKIMYTRGEAFARLAPYFPGMAAHSLQPDSE